MIKVRQSNQELVWETCQVHVHKIEAIVASLLPRSSGGFLCKVYQSVELSKFSLNPRLYSLTVPADTLAFQILPNMPVIVW